MLTLHLIRHAESRFNAEGRIQGQTDIPLSDHGRKQAQALGVRLKGQHFDRVYTSDLKRATQTAQLALPEATLIADGRLREIHLGRFQGRCWAELSPDERAALSVYYAGPFDQRVAGGESYDDLERRTVAWCAELPSEGRIVAFSHGGAIRSLLHAVVGRPPVGEYAWGFHLQNTSITTLLISENTTTIALLGDVSHLGRQGGSPWSI